MGVHDGVLRRQGVATGSIMRNVLSTAAAAANAQHLNRNTHAGTHAHTRTHAHNTKRRYG